MTKDTYWFPHDSNTSNDPKIVALVSVYGMAGKGRYWTLIELLRDQSGYRYSIEKKFSMSSLADTLKMSLEECTKFIDDLEGHFELIRRDDKFIWSEALSRRMEVWDEKKRTLSERGRKGAEKVNERKAAQVKNSDASDSAQAEQNSSTSGEQAADLSGNNSTVDNSIDNINKKNRESNDESTHTDFFLKNNLIQDPKDSPDHPEHTVWEIYKTYLISIEAKYKQIAKMEEMLTFKQFNDFQKIYPAPLGQIVFDKVLAKLNDWRGLSKHRSTYQAIINWIELEKYDGDIIRARDRAKQSNPSQLSSAVKMIRDSEKRKKNLTEQQ